MAWIARALLTSVGLASFVQTHAASTSTFNPEQKVRTPVPDGRRYEKPTVDEILLNRALAFEFAEKTRQTIAPTMHVVESDHFLVCSAWNRSYDNSLANLCERMYQRLSEQFSLPRQESVWIGKCPIYLFWDPSHFSRFVAEVDKSKKVNAAATHASGYHAARGPFSYIVINGVSEFGKTLPEATAEFYHVLVHEGTHAFLNRYVSDRTLPLWVEEGTADFVAATLVPESAVNRVYVDATRRALKRPELVHKLFEEEKELSPLQYALSQSVVRFLVARDRVAMVHFIELMKKGESEETALMRAYHASRGDLIRAWTQYWEASLKRR